MKPLFARPPFDPEVKSSLERLEAATHFDGLEDAYALVDAEGKRRMAPAIIAIIPGVAISLILWLTACTAGWIKPEWLWPIVLAVFLVTAITYVLRGSDTTQDESRLHKAIVKWRKQARSAARRKL